MRQRAQYCFTVSLYERGRTRTPILSQPRTPGSEREPFSVSRKSFLTPEMCVLQWACSSHSSLNNTNSAVAFSMSVFCVISMSCNQDCCLRDFSRWIILYSTSAKKLDSLMWKLHILGDTRMHERLEPHGRGAVTERHAGAGVIGTCRGLLIPKCGRALQVFPLQRLLVWKPLISSTWWEWF